MDDLKIEDLAGAAKDFSNSSYGKYLMKFMSETCESTLRNGMNSESSGSQLKALNVAAGIKLVIDHVDDHVRWSDNPEALRSTLNQQR